jgi:hypothetical protein
MKTLPFSSKAYSLIVALLITLTIFAIHPVKAQDMVGGAGRTDLSGDASSGGGTRRKHRRPKPRNIATTPVRTATRTKTIAVTPTTGTLVVATEPGAAILVEPLRGGTALEGSVEKNEAQFIFNDLKPGRYRVAAELNGYTGTETEVVVMAKKTTRVSINLQPITYSVTFFTNVPTGEVRYAPVASRKNPATGAILYDVTGETLVMPLQNGRVVLNNLRAGTYGIDFRPAEIGYNMLLATFTLPGRTSYNVTLLRSFVIPSTRILEQEDEQYLPTTTSSGSYYALVIGNNDYKELRRLKTAEDDAREVEAVLREQFGFETTLLLNANRQQIMAALNGYRKKLEANANLLIYYAGHGYRDEEADKAYWLPVDASKDDSSNWISADDVTTNIKVIPAKHVLIVSDSCYSGTIYRETEATVSAPAERERYLQKMKAGKSRNLMSSGGNEPVTDGGGGKHSIFAKAFLIGLTQTEKTEFTAAELFRDFIQERVAGRSDQTPEYNALRNSGHDSGDFVFVRKE